MQKTRHFTLILASFILLVLTTFGIFGFSSQKKSALLAEEQGNVNSAFIARFSFLPQGTNGYEIKNTVIFDSSYAGVLLTIENTTYRALLYRPAIPDSTPDTSWTVLGLPAPILTYSDFPDVPTNIIKTLNDLTL